MSLMKVTRVLTVPKANISRTSVMCTDLWDSVETKAQVPKQQEKSVAGLITVEGAPDVTITSGMPDEERVTRTVRIYKPAKNAMQSGTAGIKRWKIEFDNQQRWENNLMGWASSADPVSNILLDFANKEDAVAFAERHGWEYVLEDPKERLPKAKSYALNFAWNKRTRKSTK